LVRGYDDVMDPNPYQPPAMGADQPSGRSMPSNSTASARFGWAMACWFPLSVVAVAALLMQVLGHYDPRTADNMPASLFPVYLVAMGSYVALATVTSLVMLLRPPLDDDWRVPSVVVVAWVGQLAIWLTYGVVALVWPS
jgi:hypothetical protein